MSSYGCVLFGKEADDIQNDLAGLFHAFQREILHLSVEVVTAGKDVRARESHE